MNHTAVTSALFVVVLGCAATAHSAGDPTHETVDAARAEISTWLQGKRANDLGGSDCKTRTDYPGWEGISLSDCRNDHSIAGKITLTGRTLYFRPEPDRIARWIVTACQQAGGNTDMVCARATACKVISQSGTQFPIAGLNIEESDRQFDHVGAALPLGVNPTPGQVSGSLYRTALGACKKTNERPCSRYQESKLINYVFRNGVTVVRNDLSPNSNWQLTDEELAALVANDAGAHLSGTYSSDGPARLVHTTRRQYWEYMGKPGPEPRTSSLDWTDTVGAITKKALSVDDNPLLHAWVASGDYKTQLRLDRLPSCIWK
jgi:hypothetical protein